VEKTTAAAAAAAAVTVAAAAEAGTNQRACAENEASYILHVRFDSNTILARETFQATSYGRRVKTNRGQRD
jgi:hypothetical protein